MCAAEVRRMLTSFKTPIDFVMTVPLVSLAERYGHHYVLVLNLVPRVVMLGSAFVVGYFDQAVPIKAIVAAPMLSVLGGDCVFNSIVYSLVAGSTDDDVLRYVWARPAGGLRSDAVN